MDGHFGVGVSVVVRCDSDWDETKYVQSDAEHDLPYALDEGVQYPLVYGHVVDDALNAGDDDAPPTHDCAVLISHS